MNVLHQLPVTSWMEAPPPSLQAQALQALESGQLIYLPVLAFTLNSAEQHFLSPVWSDGKSKNISLDNNLSLRGARGDAADLVQLQQMIARFAEQATRLIANLFPRYTPHLMRARTSFRPCEVEQRASSYKKDDTRLHVDAFPSRPNHGMRILRVFSNINPEAKPRLWRVGEPFEAAAARYLPHIKRPLPGSAALLQSLRITKGRRSEYDHLMLHLHDKLKADVRYQREAPQQALALAANTTWIVFSDQVLHAAMGGQYMLEQTFHLPIAALREPATAPLRVLEKLRGRTLVA